MPPLVLVVEDEAILGDSIGQYLAHHAYATAVARSGEEGLRLMTEASPDVAVVDLRLPGIDGLEVMTVRRVGALRSKAVNVRIVAATNRDLEAAVAERAFRADLYYRLNVLTIDVPPFRERDGDVILLARYFMEWTVQRYGLSTKTLTSEAEVALLQYPWPGNVQELAHVVERAVLLHKEGLVDAEMLRLSVPRSEVPVVAEAGGRVLVDFSAGNIVVDEVERELIRQALQVSGWNRTEAAQRLGMSRDTLRYRIEKYRLDPAPAGA